MCALHCAQLLHTILHRTDLILFPLTLQTITIALMMSIWGKGCCFQDCCLSESNVTSTIFSERYMLSSVRLSVCRLSSVTFVRPTHAVQIFGHNSMALGTVAIHWHPLTISWRSSQGTPQPGELNTRGVVRCSDFGPIDGWCKTWGKLVLITTRKSCRGLWAFDWYQNWWPWMTLNGVMAVILRYLSELLCTMLP